MKLPEYILLAILPLVGQWADKTLPEPTKRVLYLLVCSLREEGRAWLMKTATRLDEAAWEVLYSEAKTELLECGLFPESIVDSLDEFVKFEAPAV